MTEQMFTSMSDSKMATLIEAAKHQVAVATPALRSKAAEALVRALDVIGRDKVTVIIDCDDEVFRLGYGDIAALDKLQSANVSIRQASGLRVGVLVCDERAWIFSPTALYVQTEVHSDETPNAVELRATDVQRILWRLVPEARQDLTISDLPVDLREEAANCDIEVGIETLRQDSIEETRSSLELAPPLPFDISRQVRVFTPYIQYVDISLRGVAIQRKQIEIPKSIQGLGASKEIESRLKTIFKLIEKDSNASSKSIDDKLRDIRKDFTRSLGKPWKRVLLRAVRPILDQKLAALEILLAEHRIVVKGQLANDLEQSRKNIVDFYLPHVLRSKPDALVGQLITREPTEEHCRAWLDHEFSAVFPNPNELANDMRLEVTYRDVTYETLNEDGFGEALRKAYPHVNWDKPFDEFNAAKERNTVK